MISMYSLMILMFPTPYFCEVHYFRSVCDFIYSMYSVQLSSMSVMLYVRCCEFCLRILFIHFYIHIRKKRERLRFFHAMKCTHSLNWKPILTQWNKVESFSCGILCKMHRHFIPSENWISYFNFKKSSDSID